MQEFEKLGVFYLGREYDFKKKQSKDNLILYDAKDLVTHAVCVGMTGSGKTGLCIGLLEEAAIDNIPSIVIDPKGDMANLLLTFPGLSTEDFLPWINEEDALKKGLSPEDYAGKQASLWEKGLADWGQDRARIKRLKDAADFIVYTPGSSAGIAVSILKSFQSPGRVIIEDSDLLLERINTTVTSLLNLVGIEADPIQSREHILLSTILDQAWKGGQNLDLAGFIQAIQSPGIARIGVFDLESFFPSKDRFELAMKINNLISAPGFNAWLEGEPLDIDNILYTAEGKPRIAIFSIAHLNDAERMFFVSLLLTQVLGWIRTQSGTNSLRAILYMDEIFGYFPPVANPPSKTPLLTLLKQARAFGLGIVLATQNPVDLDYKGLSNTGTWFIGRLQTDRDKARVLDGLEGAGSSAGGKFDRQKMEQTLAGLRNRVFLMNNVHEDEPVIFETRWVMSYLRGPLTRSQIKQLMETKKTGQASAAQKAAPFGEPLPKVSSVSSLSLQRPALDPKIPQVFIPASGRQPDSNTLLYEPMLWGSGTIYYTDAKAGISTQKEVSLIAGFSGHSSSVNWSEASEINIKENELEKLPESETAVFGPVPKQAADKKNYLQWSKDFKDWLYRNQGLELLKSPSLSTVSNPGEAERDFRVRLQLIAHENRDMLVKRIRSKYSPKIASLEERIRKTGHTIEREKEQASQQKLQAAISFGATILSALTGRKKVSQSSLGRAATTARSAGRIFKEGKDVDRAEETLETLQQQLDDIQALLKEETDKVMASMDPLTENLEAIELKPKKTDIAVSLMVLAWLPYWKSETGLVPAWK